MTHFLPTYICSGHELHNALNSPTNSMVQCCPVKRHEPNGTCDIKAPIPPNGTREPHSRRGALNPHAPHRRRWPRGYPLFHPVVFLLFMYAHTQNSPTYGQPCILSLLPQTNTYAGSVMRTQPITMSVWHAGKIDCNTIRQLGSVRRTQPMTMGVCASLTKLFVLLSIGFLCCCEPRWFFALIILNCLRFSMFLRRRIAQHDELLPLFYRFIIHDHWNRHNVCCCIRFVRGVR